MVGAQASNDQYEKIQSYFRIGKEEGAQVLAGGDVARAGEPTLSVAEGGGTAVGARDRHCSAAAVGTGKEQRDVQQVIMEVVDSERSYLASLEELLRGSDFVSLHCNFASERSRGMMGAAQFEAISA